MPMFKKKPVVIEARRLTEKNCQDLAEWCGGRRMYDFAQDPFVQILTLEGTMTAKVGDWIIKGIAGEFYPCKDEIFRSSYEAC